MWHGPGKINGDVVAIQSAELAGDTFLVAEDTGLLAIDSGDGSVAWRAPVADGLTAATLSADGSLAYALSTAGSLLAFDLSERTPTLAWELPLDEGNDLALAPMPDGGALVSGWSMVFAEKDGKWTLSGQRAMTAISAAGDIVWQRSWPTEITRTGNEDHWVLADGELVLAVAGNEARVWSIDHEGPALWQRETGELQSQFAAIDGQLWGFDNQSVYRLQPETRSVRLAAQLPTAFPGIEAILPLPDGRLLLAHRDRVDRRLLLLDRDGDLVWDRSYANLDAGIPSLLLADGQPLLLTQNTTRAGSLVDLYSIDIDEPRLTHIFSGGGPAASTPARAWSDDAGRVILAIPGGSMVALDIPANLP